MLWFIVQLGRHEAFMEHLLLGRGYFAAYGIAPTSALDSR
jgi:hypothetical protein